jgi:glycosyl-4,4'-diaponeurosporenoate acyltransferase
LSALPALLLSLSPRAVPQPDVWLPPLSSLIFWLLASLLVGLLANAVPARWLQGSGPAEGGQAGGRRAGSPGPQPKQPLGIRVWKPWIPDAGGALPGGVRKATLVRRDPQSLRRLLLETRRAELVHWLLLPCGLLTALWLPPAGVLVNVVFGLAFNLPCLLLQRYNRARLWRCLGRWS